MIKSYQGHTPRIHPSAHVAENATVIGKAALEAGSSVWYGAVLRADQNTIVLGENSNLQDNVVCHCNNQYSVTVGKNSSVGHCAVLHGCTIGENVLVGMGAILMNGCSIGSNSIVAAGALVTQNKSFPEGVLIMGNPAKAVRPLRPDEIERTRASVAHYVALSSEELPVCQEVSS